MPLVAVLVAQLCLTLCNPRDCSLPGSSAQGTLQARTLERVAVRSSRASSRPGIDPGSPSLQADSLPSEPPGTFLSPDYINISYIVCIMYINPFLRKCLLFHIFCPHIDYREANMSNLYYFPY